MTIPTSMLHYVYEYVGKYFQRLRSMDMGTRMGYSVWRMKKQIYNARVD